MRSGFLLTGCCLDDKKPHLFTSVSFHKKALSTLNIYNIFIRHKNQVLSKEDSRLVADRQTCNQVFLLKLNALGTLDRRDHHLSYQSGPKSPSHIFFVLTNLDCFDLGTSLKKLCLSQGRDVAYIGHWPMVIFLFDRQTDVLTDRQVGRHIYSVMLELKDLISLSVNGLSPYCKFCFVCLILFFTSTQQSFSYAGRSSWVEPVLS